MSSEAQLVDAVRRAIYARWPSALVLKIHGSPYQPAGIPDLLVCVEGRFVGIELKDQKPGETLGHAVGRTSRVQWAMIGKIMRAGGTAGVATDIETAVQIVNDALGRSQ